MRAWKIGLAFCAVAAMVTATCPAYAQVQPDTAADPTAPTDSQVNEVIVTAQRRSERLTDVPISITALTADRLNAAGITSATDLGQVTPGLQLSTTGAFAEPTIRGVGTTLTGPGADANVAMYVDGVYQPSQAANNLSFNNVQQIDVLKGPQGTLFGRNATGGAITIKTFDPSYTGEERFSASYGNFDDVKLNAYVDAPIVDGLAAFNVSGFYQSSESYITNIYDGDRLDGPQDRAVTAKLLIDPLPGLRFILQGTFNDHQDDRFSAYAPYFGGNNTLILNPSLPVPGPYQVDENVNPFFENYGRSVSFHGTYETDIGTISSITAYQYNRAILNLDGDYTPLPLSSVGYRDEERTVSQELNFASKQFAIFNFVAGLFYYHDDASRVLRSGATGSGPITSETYAAVATPAYAAFAEGNFDLTSRLHFIAGLRYSYETKDASGYRIVGPAATLNAQDSWDAVTPRASIRYDLAQSTNVYATFSQGFKSGIFNAIQLSSTPINPEKISAYEVGFKTSQHNFRMSAAAYYYDYSNLQVQSILSAGVLFYQNAASAHIYGGDLDFSADVTRDFTIDGGLAYTHGRYTNFPNALVTVRDPTTGLYSAAPPSESDVAGNTTIRTPTFTPDLTGSYSHQFEDGTFGVSATGSYNSGFFWAPDNRVKQPAYFLLSSEISWTTPNKRWRFSVWGKNLTDALQALYLSSTQAGDNVLFDAPRTFGVSVGLTL